MLALQMAKQAIRNLGSLWNAEGVIPFIRGSYPKPVPELDLRHIL